MYRGAEYSVDFRKSIEAAVNDDLLDGAIEAITLSARPGISETVKSLSLSASINPFEGG